MSKMFNQTQQQQSIFSSYVHAPPPPKKISTTKTHGCTVSKHATEIKQSDKRNKKGRHTQTIKQPGGRAKSNRWGEHNASPESDKQDDPKCEYNIVDTVKPQSVPTENDWQTRMHEISHD